MTSTENAIIFGNIVYDITGSQSDRNCVVLNDIKIDIMDYIQPAFCSDQVISNSTCHVTLFLHEMTVQL